MWIMVAILGLSLIGFAIYRSRKGRVSGSGRNQFLVIGLIWLIIGLGFSIYEGGNPFDVALFNLGLIFTVVGLFQTVMRRLQS
jgi:hypothetical protein